VELPSHWPDPALLSTWVPTRFYILLSALPLGLPIS
jgi:hypothetical protein